MRNMRRYYDNVRPLIALASYLAMPSKDAKEFRLIWCLFQEFSSSGRPYLCEQYIQPGKKKSLLGK